MARHEEAEATLFETLGELFPPPPPLAATIAEPILDFPSFPPLALETPSPSASGSDSSSYSSTAPQSPTGSPVLGVSCVTKSPIEELLDLIDWRGADRSAPKRVRGAPELSRDKHLQHEKQRRNELTQAIDDINTLVPNSEMGTAKRTKLATLQEAAEYFRRVQDMACVLIAENKRLAATLQITPPVSALSTSQTIMSSTDVRRLLVVTTFLVWMFFGIPAPFGSSAVTSFSSRQILSAEATSTSPSAVLLWLFGSIFSIAWRMVTILVPLFILWVCVLIHDMPRISREDLVRAEGLLKESEFSVMRNSNWQYGWQKHAEAMAALQRSMPTTKVGEHMFLLMQVIRAVLNYLVIGLWLERLLVYILGRQQATLLDARSYMLGTLHGPNHTISKSPIQYHACTIAAASSLNVANASVLLQDEFAARVALFIADMPNCTNRFYTLVFTALLALAEAQLTPMSMTPDPSEVSEWTMMRLLNSPVHQGRLEEAYNIIMRLIPELEGTAQCKALASAGMVTFALRQYRDAFMFFSTAVKSGITHGQIPVIAVRLLTGHLIVSLCQLNRKAEAQKLMPQFESLYLCVPDCRANVLHTERHIYLCTKIVTADTDFAAAIAGVRELFAVINSSGLSRQFGSPFILDAVAERLFAALKLANEVSLRKPANANEAFVWHHKSEINEMALRVLDYTERMSHFSNYLTPIVERQKGWHAALTGAADIASYHLNRSILEAKRLQHTKHVEYTTELMAQLGVPLLGSHPAAQPSGELDTPLASLSKIFRRHTVSAGSADLLPNKDKGAAMV